MFMSYNFKNLVCHCVRALVVSSVHVSVSVSVNVYTLGVCMGQVGFVDKKDPTQSIKLELGWVGFFKILLSTRTKPTRPKSGWIGLGNQIIFIKKKIKTKLLSKQNQTLASKSDNQYPEIIAATN